jgi:hypothetical protein
MQRVVCCSFLNLGRLVKRDVDLVWSLAVVPIEYSIVDGLGDM